MSVELEPLRGSNPLGFLAALGILDILERVRPDRNARLHWQGELLPRPIISGITDVDELIAIILEDRDTWKDSVVLHGPNGEDPSDIKPEPQMVAHWFHAAAASPHPGDLPLLHALISEGAVAGKGDSKPTHLHFTAGQQRFLEMCRILCQELNYDGLLEALVGPWARRSTLPVLGWDNEQGERLHALSSESPTSTKKTGVPGAEWVAFLGLRFFPVATTASHELITTGCAKAWKSGGSFTWPLWNEPITATAIEFLVAEDHSKWSAEKRQQRGVSAVLQAPIRRADQGGYGSFGPTSPI